MSARGGGGAKATETATAARADAGAVAATQPIANAMQQHIMNFMNALLAEHHRLVIDNALRASELTRRR
jgi:hypothetical protein